MKNLIFDISPMAYRVLFSKKDDIKMLGENVLRSELLNDIFNAIDKIKPDRVFVCFECKGYNWRKEKYNFYKDQRAKQRAKQEDINWEEFYGFLEKFYVELKENLPFISLKHDKLEADDIAAHLVRRYSHDINTVITNDSDYLQLVKYKNVKIINSKTGKVMECSSPKRYLEEKILTGDTSDNIPPIRSGIGPKTASKLIESEEIYKMLEEKDADGKPCELRRNYERNKELIDLENTPQHLLMSLENTIDDYVMVDTKKLLMYIQRNSLRALLDRLSSIRRNLTVLTAANQAVL
jgi:5'-3' exonuclease